MYVRVYVCMHDLHVYTHVRLFAEHTHATSARVYIHTHTHTHTHTYTYIHTHILTLSRHTRVFLSSPRLSRRRIYKYICIYICMYV